MTHPHHRRGTIIIIVAGISALMASLALAFVINSQADARESEQQIRDGQARIMLTAACSYILEAGRIGWEPMKPIDPSGTRAPEPLSTEYVEAFGWIDVRDGSLGPRINSSPDRTRAYAYDANGNPYPVDNRSTPNPFPVGVPVRFPMHVLVRPPFAISPRVAENPVDPAVPSTQHLRNPDPRPAVTNFNDWAKGDTFSGLGPDGKLHYRVRENTRGQSWFRLLREKSGASFIVTCGAGGTLGYRTWSEVTAADQGYFGGDPQMFEVLRQSEIRLWYRVEWNAAIVATEMNYLFESLEHSWKLSGFSLAGGGHDLYDSGTTVKDNPARGRNYSSQWRAANMGGTIQYIQRLRQEPAAW
jgi:hypothetical protein